ncbi:PREDICTED: uncharacterized protein LOC107169199 [Diuraphis noxia]|uniref:uncharacterized protein LOC107169199 n=1 Tax=Diuraphis noxia TaxID=143948 RepID=UPI0007637E59|nr:PREDICTED: uncharacterized protein LOC107169199 [Diuraphis noxia]
MKTDKIKIESSDELKNPYVRLERCSLEEINGYKLKPERNAYYLIESGSEESNKGESDDNMVSLNLVTLIGDGEKLYRSYVLLERLSPHDIQHLLNKKN